MGLLRERWRSPGVLIVMLALTPGLGGCRRGDDGGVANSSPTSTDSASAAGQELAATGPPVTDEEARAFAAAVEAAVAAGNLAAFNALIDWDAILRTATAGIDVPESSRNGFVQGVKSSMQQEQGLVPQIVKTIKDGGSYTFLRTRTREKHKTTLFRLVTSDSNGLNYHDFVLARRPDGPVKAVDIYIFLSGELLSKTMRRMFIPVAAQVSRGLLHRLLGTEQAFVKNLPKFQQMTAELRAHRPAEALKIYREFPPELQKDKNLLLIRIQAAQDLGDQEYSGAIEDFRTAHPDDACIDMISIDYYLLKKDYPHALACIDRFEKAVGGDPYLNITRANIYTEAKQYGEAAAAARRAIAEDPSLQDAYWSLVTVSLQEHRFDETVTVLNQLEERFQIPFGDMTQLPVFAEFVGSPQYRAWKARPRPAPRQEKAPAPVAAPSAP